MPNIEQMLNEAKAQNSLEILGKVLQKLAEQEPSAKSRGVVADLKQATEDLMKRWPVARRFTFEDMQQIVSYINQQDELIADYRQIGKAYLKIAGKNNLKSHFFLLNHGIINLSRNLRLHCQSK